ncbi:Lipid A disaccharide synthetase [gamma proteobacterium HdN1]|nr:Lipid A disaccharide synthetase [gamma proteobacterium HdN1]
MMIDSAPLTIGIIAGETSGDLLGAGVIEAIQKHRPNARFVGIGGPAMLRAGLDVLFPMDRLAVMGIVDVLKRLPELLAIRRKVLSEFSQRKLDLFIGIDSPDFNLRIASALHEQGVKTVHYVSPTVWAWRQGRVHGIKRTIDLMLVLFPFEAAFYEEHGVPVRFVGHPFAWQIDPELDNALAKRHWGYQPGDRVLAVLPGSRGGELKNMGPLFIEAMRRLTARDARIRFVVPYANEGRRRQFEQQLRDAGVDLPIVALDGHAREVMAGADVVLATSGTATLEAALLKRPMVVAYRMGAVSHAIFSRLVKAKHVALPNILAGEGIVPELIQAAATPDRLCDEVLHLFEDAEHRKQLISRFGEIHQQLRKNADEEATAAILELLA